MENAPIEGLSNPSGIMQADTSIPEHINFSPETLEKRSMKVPLGIDVILHSAKCSFQPNILHR
jgi:hypothetical protein